MSSYLSIYLYTLSIWLLLQRSHGQAASRFENRLQSIVHLYTYCKSRHQVSREWTPLLLNHHEPLLPLLLQIGSDNFQAWRRQCCNLMLWVCRTQRAFGNLMGSFKSSLWFAFRVWAMPSWRDANPNSGGFCRVAQRTTSRACTRLLIPTTSMLQLVECSIGRNASEPCHLGHHGSISKAWEASWISSSEFWYRNTLVDPLHSSDSSYKCWNCQCLDFCFCLASVIWCRFINNGLHFLG